MRLAYCPYTLHFREEAGTSRGIHTEKPTFLLKLWDETDPAIAGYGEAAVFPGLSPEANESYEWKIAELMANIALGKPTDLSRHSSLQFGLEQAILDLSNGGRGIYFPSPFTEGKSEIVINGLVWMGNAKQMTRRLEEKISLGFECIKIKVGAIGWDDELNLIKKIRQIADGDRITIRVDANGGFDMDSCMVRLKQLADLGVHSIEQPLPARNHELMKFLCEISPLPIALDEDLIGIPTSRERRELLEFVRPHYIVLKPALCGGFSGAREWMATADNLGIGYWITSALESSVGLDAIAQFTATLGLSVPQGLGTGNLYTDNFLSPLHLEADRLRFTGPSDAFRRQLEQLPWRE